MEVVAFRNPEDCDNAKPTIIRQLTPQQECFFNTGNCRACTGQYWPKLCCLDLRDSVEQNLCLCGDSNLLRMVRATWHLRWLRVCRSVLETVNAHPVKQGVCQFETTCQFARNSLKNHRSTSHVCVVTTFPLIGLRPHRFDFSPRRKNLAHLRFVGIRQARPLDCCRCSVSVR